MPGASVGMGETQFDNAMIDLKQLTDGELIRKHKEHWMTWRLRQQKYGWLVAGAGPDELEIEARGRGIPDAILMASIPPEYR